MKKLIFAIMGVFEMLMVSAQTYDAMWKQVEQLGDKDLPQSQIEVLERIIPKAEKERAYGHLLKAELMRLQLNTNISPDSLLPAIQRLAAKEKSVKDEALDAVYCATLYKVLTQAKNMVADEDFKSLELTPEYYSDRAISHPDALSKALCADYEPFTSRGTVAKYFNSDLLHVIGYELGNYQALYDYYNKVGNREAALLSALAKAREENEEQERKYSFAVMKYEDSDYKKSLDEIEQNYADLPLCGEVAIDRLELMERCGGVTVKDEMEVINNAIEKWSGCPRINILKNAAKSRTNPMFDVAVEKPVLVPNRTFKVKLSSVRNIQKLTLNVFTTSKTGEDELDNLDYKKLSAIRKTAVSPIYSTEKEFHGHEVYETFADSIMVRGLDPGVYLGEVLVEGIDAEYFLVNVTGIYPVLISLPNNEARVVVLNSVTGQPIPKAKIKISNGNGKNAQPINKITDSKGEVMLGSELKDYSRTIYAYTDKDKFAKPIRKTSSYYFNGAKPKNTITNIYTDRAIYRPGQTVKVSSITFSREADNVQAVEGKALKIRLIDTNWQEVDAKDVVTDAFGTASVDFVLPKNTLNGNFHIEIGNSQKSIKVEEYKRPTYEIIMPQVTQTYKAGDTLTVEGQLKTYAGAPVQGAEVVYYVTRKQSHWWWNLLSEDETVNRGTVVSDADGKFVIEIPLTIPKGLTRYFYNFEATVIATNLSGESHEGTMVVPLAYKSAVLSVNLPAKAERSTLKNITFNLHNAAGNSIDAKVKYWFDNGVTSYCNTNEAVDIMPRLTVGEHTLKAICEGDTLEQKVVVFSEDDTKPCTETNDWFWQSSDTFPIKGMAGYVETGKERDFNDKVTVQVGSSEPDIHILYAILAKNTVIEQGSVDENCSLLNRKFKYREEYGDGITLAFFWLKNGEAHTHVATIRKPLPDKQLKLEWQTFRDRLTPGQKEEWKLKVSRADGTVDAAQLMAAMYDKSLDEMAQNSWSLSLGITRLVPSTRWYYVAPHDRYYGGNAMYRALDVPDWSWSSFDGDLFFFYRSVKNGIRLRGLASRANADYGMPMLASAKAMATNGVEEEAVYDAAESMPMFDTKAVVQEKKVEKSTSQVRENLNETAFFYPQLATENGVATILFTLPECLTTWKFLGLAHTKDMRIGQIESDIVAQKELMVQPNVPRFIRLGDKASIASTIVNTSEKNLNGTARLELVNPETNDIVYQRQTTFEVAAGKSTSAVFSIDTNDAAIANGGQSLLICKVFATADGFTDGEQHYLPLLPNKEMVMNTIAITQHEASNKSIDLQKLIGKNATDAKLTIEYTNNPAWMIVQSLPSIDTPTNDDVISYLRAYYSNFLASHFLKTNPQLKRTILEWANNDEETLTSKLAQNEELKTIALNETPWVLDSNTETDWMKRLANYYDENSLNLKINDNLAKIASLQLSDGSWTWFKGMEGSYYMTLSVVEHLVRLNMMTGSNENRNLINNGIKWLSKETNKMVADMKKEEKKGHKQTFPGGVTLQYLYACAISDVELDSPTKQNNNYLINLLKKDVKNRSIFEKGLTAIILQRNGEISKAKEYVKSLKEWSVYSDEMGRYYDTNRAGYTWRDYRIPTEVSAIEAISCVTPDDKKTIEEMQRWLLQEKRTQFWATPLNTMDAIYAFMIDNTASLDAKEPSEITIDGRKVEFSNRTAGLGYVKKAMPYNNEKQLEISKTSTGTSWGAVYAQFMQPVKDVDASSTGISVTRTIGINNRHPELDSGSPSGQALHLKVGDKVKVKITIRADRDYDFIQVTDKRAACMEPVNQLSGMSRGCYVSPKDCSTNYFILMLSKGTHEFETEYFIDREGTYQYAPVTVQCAYSPEFTARSKSDVIDVAGK
ncbi:MAG: alpha-2-macroglobulin family protein [Prevotellaceae bacterium]|nr:alpha-2-macroglobulin family protein [Prevotellaceae bacterium]